MEMEGHHTPPSAAPTEFTFHQGWSDTAVCDLSGNSSVERAVDLAWMLTRYICRIVETPSLEGVVAQLEDHMKADNITISMQPTSNDSCSQHDQVITAVRLKSLISIEPALVEDSARTAIAQYTNIHSSPLLLEALGKLLLDIFLKSSSSGGLGAAWVGGNGSSDDELIDREDAGSNSAERLGKRPAKSTASADNSDSTNVARDILISVGMPLSVCRLVGDLLDAVDEGNPVEAFSSLSLQEMLGADARPMRFPIKSIWEALEDLSQMKAFPEKFLFDQKCPQKALDDTCLFNATDVQLMGREKEMSALTKCKNNISDHVHETGNSQTDNFLCKAFFLCGYAGCGKSSIIQFLTRSCTEDQWFVLGCKFTQQSSPHMMLAEAFNTFFGKWGAANNKQSNSDLPREMILSFNKICTNIFNLMDENALRHLCYFVPNFARIFPFIDLNSNSPHGKDETSYMDTAGSGRKRMRYLLHVLLKSLCSVGCPVLFTLDDLQWSFSHVLDDLSDFIVRYIHDNTLDARQKGLLVVGTFRSNEVDTEFIEKVSAMEEIAEGNVSLISIGDFSKEDINKLVSSKLCLPRRYTRELADLVHTKTRGNVFFVLEFLRSIIKNKILTHSLKYCQWMWDCDVVDMQMISDDVAQLLTSTFDQLPPTLQKTLKIISCLGFQVEEATIIALDSNTDVLSCNMIYELPMAVEERFLEKAGPLYQFTHDIIHQTIYELIPKQSRNYLHKTIGTELLKETLDDSSHTLATDQVNIFLRSGFPSEEERLLFAQSNAKAGKIAIAASSFDQARTYIDMGIQMLDVEHWQTQYSLSLDLFEMSASVSWAQGKLSEMAFPLAEILSNTEGFDDSLTASTLSVQLLMALSKFDEAGQKCARILKELGEEFPSEYDASFVSNELFSINEFLRNLTVTQMKQLPAMADKRKLSAMKFLDLLCICSLHDKLMLRPLLSCRMVKLTMEYGFCKYSIVGLATVGMSLVQVAENFELASRIGKVAESLVEQSSKKHMLRSRLCAELNGHLKLLTEPIPSAVQSLPDHYHSAMMVGDVENALKCRWIYDLGMFWSASFDAGLVACAKSFTTTIKEALKYNLQPVAHCSMATLHLCLDLSQAKPDINILSLDELDGTGEQTLWHTFISRLGIIFWMKDYVKLVELSAMFNQSNPSLPKNRSINIWRQLYEGIAYFHLARDTKDAKWEIMGEKALAWMAQMEPMSSWNFANKVQLLQAEHYYAGGNLGLAEASYKSSVESANAHRLIHEEALALELYGIFCVENQMFAKGIEQLQIALERYQKWGATKKVYQLKEMMDMIDEASACWVAVGATRSIE